MTEPAAEINRLREAIDRSKALCRAYPTRWFFPERVNGTNTIAEIARAKAICRRCTQQDACFDLIMAMDSSTQGVWGGTSYADRREMRWGKSGNVGRKSRARD